MAEHRLSPAVSGRKNLLHSRLITGGGHRGGAGTQTAAIVGLGYVGLPTAVQLHGKIARATGIDISADRLADIVTGQADLTGPDQDRLAVALADGTLELTTDPAAAGTAGAVIICVPTPVNGDHAPDLSALRAACAGVVAHARPGQVIILTSTSYVGTTRDLLTEPLRRRGLVPGSDIYVAFSPERIGPGNPDRRRSQTPRVVGGTTPECASRAAEVIGRLTDSVYLVGSPDVAEAAKLYENIVRAVSLALANEFADACGALGLDPVEVTLAAATKPDGFPGPGGGGHRIPGDPHYLLWQLNAGGRRSPLIEQAMTSIAQRPGRVAGRAAEVLAASGRSLAGARVLVLGASCQAGVRDLRESPALALLGALLEAGAEVSYFDPLIPVLDLPGGRELRSEPGPRGADWDLIIAHTLHPGVDYSWAQHCPRVLDATDQFFDAAHRVVV